MPERLAADPDADIDDLLPWTDGIQKRFAMRGTGAKNALTISIRAFRFRFKECPDRYCSYYFNNCLFLFTLL